MSDAILQGAYDGLCGIYAALNAANHLLRLNDKDRAGLFEKMVRLLSKSENFARTILKGIDADQMKDLLKLVCAYAKKNFSKKILVESITTDDNNSAGMWRNFSEFLNDGDEYNRIILIGLDNKYEHWTCVNRMTRAELQLIDSSRMKTIKRSTITTGETVKKHFRIVPGEAWGLRLID